MRRLRLLVSALTLFALIAACGASGGPSSDDDTRGYTARSAQLGHCEPFSPTQRFAPDEPVCVDLMLEGYYTAGTLTARFYLEDQQVGQSTIEFSSWKALSERLSHGEAVSRVSF